MRQGLLIVAVVLACGIALSKSVPTVAASAAPTVSAADVSAASVPIPFGDPQHAAYFNFQAFQVRDKLPGETQQTWEALTAADRAAKVKEGEASLSKKHAELLAKLRKGTISDKEKELLAAVWPETRRPSKGSAIPVAGKGSPAQTYVASVSEGVDHVKDWALPFDGGVRGSAGAVEAVSAGVAASASPVSSKPVSLTAAKNESLAAVPVPGRSIAEPRKKRGASWPLAGGAAAGALVSAALLGLRWKNAAKAASAPADAEEFSTIKGLMAASGRKPKPHPCGHHHDCGATCGFTNCVCTPNCGCTGNCACVGNCINCGCTGVCHDCSTNCQRTQIIR